MNNIIDFRSMVAKLNKIDPTSLSDIKKQIIHEMKTPTPPSQTEITTPLSQLRELAGLPTQEMSKKKIKKAHKSTFLWFFTIYCLFHYYTYVLMVEWLS